LATATRFTPAASEATEAQPRPEAAASPWVRLTQAAPVELPLELVDVAVDEAAEVELVDDPLEVELVDDPAEVEADELPEVVEVEAADELEREEPELLELEELERLWEPLELVPPSAVEELLHADANVAQRPKSPSERIPMRYVLSRLNTRHSPRRESPSTLPSYFRHSVRVNSIVAQIFGATYYRARRVLSPVTPRSSLHGSHEIFTLSITAGPATSARMWAQSRGRWCRSRQRRSEWCGAACRAPRAIHPIA
jgi:hypothetical protein